MRAYKVAYPPKDRSLSLPELALALQYIKPWTVDFPERHVSYKIIGCKQADLPRCVEEVCRAVDRHQRGQEPPLWEIRLAGPN